MTGLCVVLCIGTATGVVIILIAAVIDGYHQHQRADR